MFMESWKFFRAIAKKWAADNGPLMAAGLAFYTTLSFVPLFMVIFLIATQFVGEGPAREELIRRIAVSFDFQTADTVRAMFKSLRNSEAGVITVFSVLIFIFGATKSFRHMSAALNVIWSAAPGPRKNWWSLLWGRLIAVVMVLGVGCFLLVSMVVDALLQLVERAITPLAPGIDIGFWNAVNYLAPLVMFMILFACFYRFLPHSKVRWPEAWMGAGSATVLFSLGRILLAFFFSHSPLVSIYGAVGSFIVVMLWFYFLAQIFLFGAEITWASGKGVL